ncbi:hypothetical protein JOD43_000065 [Pullulanibacillus pueri]|uniref:Uncharacterized protein n=1 Tax=Pullulanibacillus pueri TaxID=1437324 RepID=A0A8J3EJS3_9BACL|nr:hypothetical protein [Pullulanibacillus pueri]MBM7679906.1 hypothetical protein [Pullulanibacillus pueri]GGH73424.1 hypothetical protein GCM10007096_00640 [Pullulanibacillus pueri]
MLRKTFSVGSGLCFLVTLLPLIGEKFGLQVYQLMISIHSFFPFELNALGLILGWFGMKGNLRVALLILNLLSLFFHLFVFLMATYGFQEP